MLPGVFVSSALHEKPRGPTLGPQLLRLTLFPFNCRYVHAYQSFLWNHAATHRIMLYGEPASTICINMSANDLSKRS